ncbi:MAG: nucleotidyltransferase family protein [Candidatus Poribacteria bacterium]
MKALQEIQTIIDNNKQILIERFKINQIGIFGSYARGEQTPESDIDILVDFSEIPGLEFVNLAKLLERLLDEKVDLVSRGAIRPDRWKYIEEDIIYV